MTGNTRYHILDFPTYSLSLEKVDQGATEYYSQFDNPGKRKPLEVTILHDKNETAWRQIFISRSKTQYTERDTLLRMQINYINKDGRIKNSQAGTDAQEVSDDSTASAGELKVGGGFKGRSGFMGWITELQLYKSLANTSYEDGCSNIYNLHRKMRDERATSNGIPFKKRGITLATQKVKMELHLEFRYYIMSAGTTINGERSQIDGELSQLSQSGSPQERKESPYGFNGCLTIMPKCAAEPEFDWFKWGTFLPTHWSVFPDHGN